MAIGSINPYSTKFRLGGLATGLDTDQMVSDLMKAERLPLDKIMQKRQLAEWKRDNYRDITNLLRSLKDEFMSNLKPSSNILYQSSYKKFVATTSDSAVVSVSGNADAAAGTHTISVFNLATADVAASAGGVTKALQGNTISDFNLAGKSIRITLDGVTKEITMDNYSHVVGTPSTSDIVTKPGTGLQALIDQAFGAGKIAVAYDGNTDKVSFASVGGASRITLSTGTTNDGLGSLGFTSGATNRLDTGLSLQALSTRFATDLTFVDNKLNFTINGKPFEFASSVTLASMMNTVNSDETAKVNMQYDEASDGFIITAKQLGDGDNIVIDAVTQAGNFFGVGGVSRINTGSATTSQGVDALVKIDVGTPNEQTIKRSSNSFTLNGMTYNLLKPHDDPNSQSANVSLSLDVDGIFNNIKSFVEKYNEIIGKINGELTEKYDRDFQPLTDEQKESMETEDIKKWEEKAKTGLLRNDSLLQDLVYGMRRALTDSVKDAGITLSAIGITTGTFEERGKLHLDENKLKAAISSNADAVMNLFTRKSSVSTNLNLTPEQRTQRMEEEGLAYRLSDILDENIRTARDSKGKKGKLLEKAGIPGDLSEFRSVIYDEINGYDKQISRLLDKLADKETKYYQRFAAMEKAISRMNSQSSWLSSQMGGGQ